jgi:putative RNA 2'-phosphotransferase
MAIPTYKPKILYPWLQKPNEQPSAPPPPAQNVEPVPRFLDSTRRSGLTKGNRHHVHLSPDIQTATRVGQRRGRPVVLLIEAGRRFRDGHKFFRSENGVWLTDAVPPGYIRK